MGSSSSSQAFDYDHALLSDPSGPRAQILPYPIDQIAHGKRSGIYRSSLLSVDEPLVASIDNGAAKTVWETWKLARSRGKENKCLGSRVYTLDALGKYVRTEEKGAPPQRGEYKFVSFDQVDGMVRNFGAGLASLGVQVNDAVGIYSINRAEWTVAAFGNYSQTFRTVALYDTLGSDAAEYIVNHAECKVLICSKDKVAKSLAFLKNCPTTKIMIQFDVDETIQNVEETLDEADVKKAEELGIRLLAYSEVLKLGQESGISTRDPSPDDLALIMYTSGTTGMPKGVMLTHKNVTSAVGSVLRLFNLFKEDVHVSYLPLAHIFETTLQCGILSQGGSICYYQGDPRKLPDDFSDAKISIMAGVPRVFEKIYDRVMKTVSSQNCIAKYIVQSALSSGTSAFRRREAYSSTVLNSIRDKIGLSRVRLIISGAAPLPPYLAEFLRVLIGAPVCQGYGMTENAAGCTIVAPDDFNLGHVGAPVSAVEICLEDVPEMNYLHTDTLTDGSKLAAPRGEILVRGNTVFSGYYKNESATKECFEADGWLHTGDIGRFNPNGTLSIIDRKKNLLKLSQGEYIALEKVEASYKNSWSNQLWVYGNGFHSKLLAVVVPAADTVVPWLDEKGYWPSKLPVRPTPEFLTEFKKQCEAHSQELNAKIFDALNDAGKAAGIKGFEKVHAIILELELDFQLQGFTVENDLVTPTQKFKRNLLMKRYETQLRELYAVVEDPCKEHEKW